MSSRKPSLRQRLRQRIARLGQQAVARGSLPESFSLKAELPGMGALPFMHIEAQLQSEPSDDGDSLHFRARIETRFSALTALPQADSGRAALGSAPRGTQLALGALRKQLARPAVQQLIAPLQQLRLSHYLDIRSSSQRLDRGALAMLPNTLQQVGITPDAAGPPLQTWFGELPAPNAGIAQVTTLALNKRDLPERLQKQLGKAPFHLAGTIVHIAEQDHGR